jgi:hypothetical protein
LRVRFNFPNICGAKNRAAFAQIIFYDFIATAFGENAPKYDVQCKCSNLKIFSKISAEMLVKDISIFCAIYSMLAPLRIAQIGWSN